MSMKVFSNNIVLHSLFLLTVFSSCVCDACICHPPEVSTTTLMLHQGKREQHLSTLKRDYGADIQKYFLYSDTIGQSSLPATNYIHTVISGGNKPFSLLTAANHQAYAYARGMQYRYVIPEEYMEELGARRPYWMKVFALRDLLQCEHIPEGSWVMWLDDDIVITDFSNNAPMPDRYIKLFSKDYQVLVTDDINKAKLNTGIILVKKTEETRHLMQHWLFFSDHPVHGYEPQGKTLHEQEVLRNFMSDAMFTELNSELRLVKIVPSRRDDIALNLNTFKREGFVKDSDWQTNIWTPDDGEKKWKEGDAFVHCGANDYKPKIIMHTLDALFEAYPEVLKKRKLDDPESLSGCLRVVADNQIVCLSPWELEMNK